MRFLKTKIRLSQEASMKKELVLPGSESSSHMADPRDEHFSSNVCIDIPNHKPKTKKRSSKANSASSKYPTKNIIINYGNAIASFALSKLATPYLQSYIDNKQIVLQDFLDFVTEAKTKITGLEGFRSILLFKDEDPEKTLLHKKILRTLGETFLQHFCIDWINQGKVSNKKVHLKYRAEIIKRIQNPENFTYLT